MQTKLQSLYAKSIEMKARRRASRLGFFVTKSRRGISLDNLGEFMLVDAQTRLVVGGDRFDWTVDAILDYLNTVD